jgi:hypothetical protein
VVWSLSIEKLRGSFYNADGAQPALTIQWHYLKMMSLLPHRQSSSIDYVYYQAEDRGAVSKQSKARRKTGGPMLCHHYCDCMQK